MPPRVMPPGEFFSYSNHGMALAGYLIEIVSGQPYEEYIKKHILQPLSMHNTYYRPSSEEVSKRMKAYIYSSPE